MTRRELNYRLNSVARYCLNMFFDTEEMSQLLLLVFANKIICSYYCEKNLSKTFLEMRELNYRIEFSFRIFVECFKCSQEMSKRKDIAANTIQALTSELRTTKQALDEIIKREHQVPTSTNGINKNWIEQER